MRKAFVSLLIFLAGSAHAWQSNEIPQVPSSIEIAGMKLKITDDARKEIQKDVNALRASDKYFRIKLDRVNLYFPIIERVFKEEGVPDDLKFLSVQESALISDAVSTSDAVGYWQFKDFTAREVGLRVDNKVDERKNIVSASHGAAQYFKRNNMFFNNWIYAVNAYMTGPGGAQRFVDKSNYGKDKMTIDKHTHWYVLRFIAHVIAFRDEIGQPHSEGLKLVEYTKGANKHLDDIADKYNVDREIVKDYNKWLRHGKIPDDKVYTVILPIKGKVPKIKDDDITAPLTRTKEEQQVLYPKVLTGEIINEKAMEIEINGKDAVIAAPGDNLDKLALKTRVSGSKLEKFNDLRPGQELKAGGIYYTQRKRNRSPIRFHVAQYGESLWDISQKYGVKLKKLAKKNRMEMSDPVKPGRVVWLRKNRDADEPIQYEDIPKPKPRPVRKEPVRPIVKEDPNNEPSQKQPATNQERVSGSTPPGVPTNQPLEKVTLFKYHPVKEGETLAGIAAFYGLSTAQILEWNELNTAEEIKPGLNLRLKTDKDIQPIQATEEDESQPDISTHSKESAKTSSGHHIVQAGETLWGISRQYNVTVEDLTSWNDLEGGTISPGQKLKVSLGNKADETQPREETMEETSQTAKNHIVQAGESLWELAQKYGITVEDLQKWNDLKPGEALAIGQRISLAISNDSENETKPASEYATFIVKGGDSLYKIAREFDMTVEELMELNDLESTSLSVGQELKVIKK